MKHLENNIEQDFEFNNDVKNISIIYAVICFIILYFYGLHSNKIHQKELNKTYNMVQTSLDIIQEQRVEIEALDEGLQSINGYADYLEERINQMERLDKILKDLQRSWVGK